MTNEQLLKNLEVPGGMIDVVLDTDAFNEIDDQFAIAYLLANSDKLNVKAILAAPFLNALAESAKEGMEKSYEEILRLLELLEKDEYKEKTFPGSSAFLPDEKNYVYSEAAVQLADLASSYSPEQPLYVIAIGAITNIASAILMKPEIAEKMVVVWLGGQSREYHDTREFNLYQDIAAARVVFTSGTPIVQLPCKGVVSGFTVSYVELEHFLKGMNPVCDFLVERVKRALMLNPRALDTAPTRILWDVVAVAWLLNQDDKFMLSRVDSLAVPGYNHQYFYDESKQMCYVYYIKRDALMTDLFLKLTDGACADKLWKKEE